MILLKNQNFYYRFFFSLKLSQKRFVFDIYERKKKILSGNIEV